MNLAKCMILLNKWERLFQQSFHGYQAAELIVKNKGENNMKEKLVKIIIDPPEKCIRLMETDSRLPTFAFLGEKPVGMIVHIEGRGWITYCGEDSNAYTPIFSREECIRIGIGSYGFKYYTERPPASI